ncbi:unnamed protein product [Owenia fusiformis]|uniref:Uncharacterized protein n=1 Tax=Owenia fusiformis TaxID=6347 RepID=A0A8S4N4D9_OWEFU|nr:unnamed protein product [Owenia fusiformis]
MAATVTSPRTASTGRVRNMADFRAKRTEAMPKNSLFGSILEHRSKQELEDAKNIDLNAVQFDDYKPTKRPPKQWTVPEHIKVNHRFAGDESFQTEKAKLEKQLKQAGDATKQLDKLGVESLYFRAPNANVTAGETHIPETPQPSQWYNETHVNNAEKINIVGLKDTKGFDYQKSKEKPPVHQYSIIGDPLRLGMEFNDKEQTSYKSHMFPLDVKSYGNKPQMGRRAKFPIGNGSNGISDVPLNIQHKFGTKICRSALSDLDKVQESLRATEEVKNSIHRKPRRRSQTVPLSPSLLNPKYDQISNGLRYNVFPGYNFTTKSGVTHEVHNMDPHERRYKDPDEWRHTQDELGYWAEHNILRQRMKKAWNIYLEETLKPKQAV